MMKTLATTLALAAILAVGCNQETEKAKTPGSGKTPAEANTFQLELPTAATNIAKGAEELVEIGVERGEDMKGAIALTFEAPEGITIEPASPEIAEGEEKVEVTVKVGADVAAGEKSIPIKGKADGKETSGSFKIEVTEP